MFNKDLVAELKDRIKSLEDVNAKLLDQIIVLSGKVTDNITMQQAAMPYEQPSYLDYLTGEIKKIPAQNPEEEEQQAQAIQEAEKMFNTAGVI